ncbi:uncharacterized protein EI90DRAFT_3017495 [Cantharellus anzutake]|uniref:uncharacterized protein n=1 Tax=Cantharellus anzutake TaxID=1750568 RepID=UPI0019086C93|nr:uncharacterized protein EI90DRAFT_3017495 [Cantharellus anzutake]KAF8328898.1 hypothetical protein EI90DRAFT_3017495 [Cantharellus anzutake]
MNDVPYQNPHYLSPVPHHKPAQSASQLSLLMLMMPLVSRGNEPGFLRSLIPPSIACRLYLSVVLLETFIDLVIEGTLLIRVNKMINVETQPSEHDNATLLRSKLPVLLVIFCLAHIFQFAFALDAVIHQNVLQFIFLAIFNALFFVYSVMQIFEVQVVASDVRAYGIPISALTGAIPVVIGIAQIAYMALGWRIYKEFGWNIYKQIGADRRIKKLYAQYQIFECLVRFDAFFWLGFSVQLVSLVLEKGDFEFYLTIAAFPLSMLLLLEGHLAARYENRTMMSFFIFGLIAALVYFSYKLFRIWTQKRTDMFKDVWKSLTIFSCISIGLLIITLIWSFLVFRDFGLGLKENSVYHGRR